MEFFIFRNTSILKTHYNGIEIFCSLADSTALVEDNIVFFQNYKLPSILENNEQIIKEKLGWLSSV